MRNLTSKHPPKWAGGLQGAFGGGPGDPSAAAFRLSTPFSKTGFPSIGLALHAWEMNAGERQSSLPCIPHHPRTPSWCQHHGSSTEISFSFQIRKGLKTTLCMGRVNWAGWGHRGCLAMVPAQALGICPPHTFPHPREAESPQTFCLFALVL